MQHQQRLRPASSERRREELFTQRYAQLRSWALRLTNQDRESAEDLVQDAFIQFALGRTSLEEIENIDGYLRRMLRYMYLSKMNRNSQKFFEQTLSISDYDSFHQTWRAIEPPEQMQAQEELCHICAYACMRKETSRAGSVLILRFFHDYYPTEIARVLCSSRHCIDQWQRLARSELKLYLTKPSTLRFVNAKTRTKTKTALTKLSAVNCDVIGELRQMIFRSRQGECLREKELQEIYKRENPEALTTTKLAHIVSCPTCLDFVNQLTGLPSLAERYHSQTDDHRDPPSDGSRTNSENTPVNYQRRLREVREHKPAELRIAVNGRVLSSLRISSESSELDLNLVHEQVDFIEVFSEQGVQLLFLSLDEVTRVRPQHWARIDLSEDRRLEAVLSFEPAAALHLSYFEPAMQPAPVNALLRIVGQGEFSGSESAQSKNPRTAHTRASLASFLHRFVRWIAAIPRNSTWTRPEVITAIISMLMLATILFLKTQPSTVPHAMTLLSQASLVEEMTDHPNGFVTHRIINLEEREYAGGPVLERQRIEIWEQQNVRARRLYDDRDKLLAAICERADGSATVYHHGSKPQVHLPSNKATVRANIDDVWQLEFSASEFRKLIADPDRAHVEKTPATLVLKYDRESVVGNIHVLSMSITLNRSNLHAIEQAMLVEQRGEVRHYTFVETGFEQLPRNSLTPNVFEIEPETVTGQDNASNNPSLRGVTSVSVPLSLPHAPVASPELEVDVAYLLNQAKGDRNEQITWSRTAEGMLRVEGVVDSEQRKLELLRILAPVSNNPAVRIEISSVTEGVPRQSTPRSQVVVREAEETANTIAVYSELHSYFTKAGLEPDRADEAVRAFSSKAVNRAYRILFHAIELKRLSKRFANVEMRALAPDARTKWLQMTRDHAAVIEREIALLRQELQPIFLSNMSITGAEEPEITNDLEMGRAIELLHKVTLANNEAVREAFTISSRSSSAAIKSVQFWRALRAAEQLAAGLRKHQDASLR